MKWMLAFVGAVSLAGCGDGGTAAVDSGAPATAAEEAAADSAESPRLPDPCTLLSDEEINAALDTMNNGYKVSRREFAPFPDIGGGQCNIEARNAQGFSTSFSIAVSPAERGALFIGSGTRTSIPGIGDEAFEVRDNYYAMSRGVLVHVVNAPGTSQAQTSAQFLRAAIGRL